MKPFTRLAKAGVLGMNSRNLDFIAAYNPRRYYPLVDDKIITKKLAIEAGVTVPEQFGVIRYGGEINIIERIAKKRASFVVKPSRGSGGGGIMVFNGLAKTGLRRMNGQITPWADVKYHISNMLSGMFSMGDGSDSVLIEERLVPHSAFSKLAFGGVPDVRVIVFRGIPVMAMLRLPTAESDGKANLHQGGVGAGIDLVTGITTRGVQHNDSVDLHPDFETPVRDFQVPAWPEILELASRLGHHIGLGYVGVDIVICEHKGPTLLELNARPGIAIQTANLRGLRPLLMPVHKLPSVPEDVHERIEICKANWRGEPLDRFIAPGDEV
ncbi:MULTISPECIES: alpha-L-glutamate ligase-like protein [Henriciella]|jgi:alpha-L-glutamate ligase-like protein|uniref:Alpha-L-glutamate ligase-like protein n=3 Tax=Henriciella pelagia TaxID=1977912 RepID=A0ABQ1J3Z7_9PROT|nr:alpha-L-glutamate ligase-like protein [Henriciella pelagia]GGB59503.1 alpha-L-glutamate ligase-like protein [Henriciella pelagia]